MLRYVPVLILALALPGAASALVIDSFDDAATVTANSGMPSTLVSTASGSFLGTDRELSANWTSGANDVTGAVDPGSSSQLNISLGADTLGSVDVFWQNIGGADLTESGSKNGIALSIAFDDLPAEIKVVLTDTSLNSGMHSVTSTPTFSCCNTESLLFSSFSGSVDFTSIERIQLIITPDFPAADLQIDFIESAVVPEPGTALLLGTGLLGLAWRGRRAA